MRNRAKQESRMLHENEPTADVSTRAERWRNNTIRYGAMSSALALGALSLHTGRMAASENIKDHNIQQFLDSQRSPEVETTDGSVKVEAIEVNVGDFCVTAYLSRVEGVKTRLPDSKDGKKYRQAEVSADVRVPLCIDMTQADAFVNHQQKTVDVYVPDESALYAKAELSFDGIEVNPDGSVKLKDNMPFKYDLSGSASTIAERNINELAEGLGIEWPIAKALDAKMTVQDSLLVNVGAVKVMQQAIEACAAEVYEVAHDDIKDGIASQPKQWGKVFDSRLLEEEYDFRTYIGDESPENPRTDLNPRFEYDYTSAIAKLKLNSDVEISDGSQSECEAIDEIEVIDKAEARNE